MSHGATGFPGKASTIFNVLQACYAALPQMSCAAMVFSCLPYVVPWQRDQGVRKLCDNTGWRDVLYIAPVLTVSRTWHIRKQAQAPRGAFAELFARKRSQAPHGVFAYLFARSCLPAQVDCSGQAHLHKSAAPESAYTIVVGQTDGQPSQGYLFTIPSIVQSENCGAASPWSVTLPFRSGGFFRILPRTEARTFWYLSCTHRRCSRHRP